MLGSSSWMPYAPQGVKGTDGDNLASDSSLTGCYAVQVDKTSVRFCFFCDVTQRRLVVMLCYVFFTTHCSLRLIVRSELDVTTFATRRLHARASSGGRWNCGREMSGNFA